MCHLYKLCSTQKVQYMMGQARYQLLELALCGKYFRPFWGLHAVSLDSIVKLSGMTAGLAPVDPQVFPRMC